MDVPFHRTSAKTYSLTVFTGTTASLLRAGGARPSADFTSEDLICTATLDKATYKLVARAPLLHSAILHAVGEKMSSLVATDLSREYAQNGRVTKDSSVLKVAASQGPASDRDAGRLGARQGRRSRLRGRSPDLLANGGN